MRCVFVGLFDVVGLISRKLGASLFLLVSLWAVWSHHAVRHGISGVTVIWADWATHKREPCWISPTWASSPDGLKEPHAANILAPTQKRRQMHSKYFIDNLNFSCTEGMADIAYHSGTFKKAFLVFSRIPWTLTLFSLSWWVMKVWESSRDEVADCYAVLLEWNLKSRPNCFTKLNLVSFEIIQK